MFDDDTIHALVIPDPREVYSGWEEEDDAPDAPEEGDNF